MCQKAVNIPKSHKKKIDEKKRKKRLDKMAEEETDMMTVEKMLGKMADRAVVKNTELNTMTVKWKLEKMAEEAVETISGSNMMMMVI